MATRRKTKAKKLKFELTRSAIGGISVVTFCLFLWMFLLGVWAGQSLLIPSYTDEDPGINRLNRDSKVQIIRADKKPIKKRE